MRTILCALLLSAVLATGHIAAGELTTAQVQQILSAAQLPAAAGAGSKVEVLIAGKPVVFVVTRDATGTILARPEVTPSSADATISLVRIQATTNEQGQLIPRSLVLVTSSGSVQTYSVAANADGTLASIAPSGTFAPVVPQKTDGKPGEKDANHDAVGGGGSVSVNSATQFSPPAGAGTADASPVR